MKLHFPIFFIKKYTIQTLYFSNTSIILKHYYFLNILIVVLKGIKTVSASTCEVIIHLLRCIDPWLLIIIIIISSFFIALNTSWTSLSALQITPVIGFSACPHTLCAQSPLPGEHSSQALIEAQKLFDISTILLTIA